MLIFKFGVEKFLKVGLSIAFLALIPIALYWFFKPGRSPSKGKIQLATDDFESREIGARFKAEGSSGEPEGTSLSKGETWLSSLPSNKQPDYWSLPLLQSLEWKRFETLCSDYFRLIGYTPEETRIGADGGVDIWVYKPGREKPIGIVQVKAWTTYKVGVKPVRELFGVMAAEGVANGKFITSGEFTSEAIEFAKGKKLELISGERFLSAIKILAEEKQSELLQKALEGDYHTPTCPQCGSKMKLRQASKSRNKFWGCPRYPKCRSTLVYKPAPI